MFQRWTPMVASLYADPPWRWAGRPAKTWHWSFATAFCSSPLLSDTAGPAPLGGHGRLGQPVAPSAPVRHPSPQWPGVRDSTHSPRRPDRGSCRRPAGVSSRVRFPGPLVTFTDQQRAVIEALDMSPGDLRGLAGALQRGHRVVSVRDVDETQLAILP